MMASKPIFMYSSPEESISLNGTSLDVAAAAAKTSVPVTPVQVATVVSLVVGLWQVSEHSHHSGTITGSSLCAFA